MSKKIFHVNTGFTLIELLIVMVTTGILMGVGYAGYRNFSRQKELENAAADVRSMLRLAQEYSLSGKKISGYCDNPGETITSFVFQRTANTYFIEANCSIGANFTMNETQRTLPSNLLFAGATNVEFYTLGKGSSANRTFTIRRGTQTQNVYVTASGQIR